MAFGIGLETPQLLKDTLVAVKSELGLGSDWSGPIAAVDKNRFWAAVRAFDPVSALFGARLATGY